MGNLEATGALLSKLPTNRFGKDSFGTVESGGICTGDTDPMYPEHS